MRRESLVSSQSCPGVDTDAWCKWSLISRMTHLCLSMTMMFSSLQYLYWPQRSCAKVIFLHVCVILSTGGGSAPLHAGYTPQEQTSPPEQAPRAPTPPVADTPLKEQAPPGAEPPGGKHPPVSRHPPPGIRSMSGRYASYWNAFLFLSDISWMIQAYIELRIRIAIITF